MSYNYSITSVSSARVAYRKMKEEPEFYKGKMRKMINAEHLNLDFSKTKAYIRELETLKKSASSCASKMDSVINKLSGKDDKSDREDAKILKNNFLQISKEFKTIAENIENTEADFKAVDKRMLIEADKVVSDARVGTAKLSLSKLSIDKAASPASNSTDPVQKVNDNPETGGLSFDELSKIINPKANYNTSTQMYGLTEDAIAQLKEDELRRVLSGVDDLTEDELKHMLNLIPYDERGFVVSLQNPIGYLSDALNDYREGFVNETADRKKLREDLENETYHDKYLLSFSYFKDGKLENIYSNLGTGETLFGGHNNDEIMDTIALYNISRMTEEDYKALPDAFTAFGKSWFNVPAYENMMTADIANMSNAEVNEMCARFNKISEDVITGALQNNNEYALEQLALSSYNYYEGIGDAPVYFYQLNENYSALAAGYSAKVAQTMANSGVQYVGDNIYALDKDNYDKMLFTETVLSGINNNLQKTSTHNTRYLSIYSPVGNMTSRRNSIKDYNQIRTSKNILDISHISDGFKPSNNIALNFKIEDQFLNPGGEFVCATPIDIVFMQNSVQSNIFKGKILSPSQAAEKIINDAGRSVTVDKLISKALEATGIPLLEEAIGVGENAYGIYKDNIFYGNLLDWTEIGMESTALRFGGSFTKNTDGSLSANNIFVNWRQAEVNLVEYNKSDYGKANPMNYSMEEIIAIYFGEKSEERETFIDSDAFNNFVQYSNAKAVILEEGRIPNNDAVQNK